MTRLVFNPDPNFLKDDNHDIKRIIAAVGARGYKLRKWDAYSAWTAYSRSMCAGWMRLPETDDMLWEIIKPYLRET